MSRRKKRIGGTGIHYRLSAVSLSLLILMSIFVQPAHGIRMTDVKHLFDIEHQFKDPSDVSVSRSGKIYVVDGVNNQIKIFSEKGEFLSAFGRKGSRAGEFRYPLGIDIDQSGRVYIADSGNHRIQVFDPTGGFIAEIGIPPGKSRPSDPTDVAVDNSRNRCYVVDNDNHYILVYDLSNRRLIETFGNSGTEKREFRYPFLMDLDQDGCLYIVEVINTRVQVLTPKGLFVTFVGGWGVEKGEFFRPKGVAVGKNKRVYVSDSYMGVIQIFDEVGEFYSVLGDPAMGKVKRFKTPVGLFIDNDNRLYVVEMSAQKVSVYHIEDK